MNLFISYAHKDTEFTHKLVDALHKRRHDVWIDDERLRGADLWWDEIVRQIKACECFLTVLTPTCIDSIYCEAELRYALALNKPILPLIYEVCTMPAVLSKYQWINAPAHTLSFDGILLECVEALFALRDELNNPNSERFKLPLQPPPTPEMPELQSNKAGKGQSEVYTAAAKAEKARDFSRAERLYTQVVAADPASHVGRAAKESLAEMLLRIGCERDYEHVVQLMDDPDTIRQGRALLKSFLETCGEQFDTQGYAKRALPHHETGRQDAKITPDQQRLLALMFDANRPVTDRAEAGRQINDYGDPRPGVGLRPDGLPDIVWCEVPAGEFAMGSNQDSDNKVRKVMVAAFRIARYPVTYRQFQAFIDAPDGYADARWWQGLHADGLAQQKDGPGAQQWPYDNHPRETVSWYDSIAFCRWLSAKLGYAITLPTEEQWEKAARGADGREYPWGNGYPAGRANTDESSLSGRTYLKQTTAVGLYPGGESPYHVLDMSGNVWEWCLNEYDTPANRQVNTNSRRALRGGSWYYGPFNARAAFRDYGTIDVRDYIVGVRLAATASL